MSDRDPATIDAEIATDWLTLTGILAGLLDHARNADKTQPSWNGGPDAHANVSGFKMTVFAGEGIGRVVADVWISGDRENTRIRVKTIRGNVPYWEDRLALLNSIAIELQSVRRNFQPGADEAIERYYRSRAAGSRKTLRQIAAETAYSYDYLRKAKRQYDAEGKWGSKKEPGSSKNDD